MKKFLVFLIVMVIIAAIAGLFYWENHKKQIIKDTLQTAIGKQTDSLYSIHYDSSAIDEVNGNASFYNIRLKPDSIQINNLRTSGKLPGLLLNIQVNQIKAVGVNVAGLLSKQTIAAKIIYIENPIIQITNTGSENLPPATTDTLALYKQLLGKFNSIKADSIEIVDGEVSINDKDGKILSSFTKVNIALNNFIVDSTHDYSNIASYFIKDVKASVQELQFAGSKENTRVVLNNVDYDAAKKTLAVQHIRQYDTTDNKASIDINKIEIDGLNTNAFILQQQLKAGSVTCDGGILTLVTNAKTAGPTTNKGDVAIQLSNNFFGQAQVDAVNISNTQIVIINQQKPDADPFVLNNVKFSVSKRVNISDGVTLSDLINDAKWELSSDGFSINTKNGVYKITVGNLTIANDMTAQIKIDGIHLKPLLSEKAYGIKNKQQKDLYDFDFNNIVLTGVNIKELISDNKIEMEEASVQPQVRIFADRTLPADDTSSRFGTYPHQALVKLGFPFYIKTLHLVDGLVSYRERGSESGLVGELFFDKLNGAITNVTNIPDKIKENPLCILDVKAMFLGKGNFSTKWVFPLNTTNGSFDLSGHLGQIDAHILNPVVKPLGLMTIKDGNIDGLTFNVKGNDYGTTTGLSLLYHTLDMNILKKTTGADGKSQLKKKGFLSFIAGIVIKPDNPLNGETRKIDGLAYKRDLHNPFFYVVWTSIFTAAKKITLGKE
jgi:hypothetical protein